MKRKAPQYKPTARKSTRTVSRDTLVLSSLIVENEEINPEQSNILNEGELMTDDEDQQLINELNRKFFIYLISLKQIFNLIDSTVRYTNKDQLSKI